MSRRQAQLAVVNYGLKNKLNHYEITELLDMIGLLRSEDDISPLEFHLPPTPARATVNRKGYYG